MEDEAVKFYQKLLGTEDDNCSKVDVNWLQDLLQFQLPAEMRSFWIQPVTEAEIKAVVFSSPSNKSLGPDGYTSEFYETSWPVIGDLVVRAVQEFFATGKILRGMISTLITLVPKILNPTRMTEFRPISCCNMINKFISKS
ncbi:hypothetical protein SLE2022_152320 [Rubroshorea leprosula]